MKNTDIQFNSIIYNIDRDVVDFIYIGKLTILDKIKYKCRAVDKKKNMYAFNPYNASQFMEFLNNTKMILNGDGVFDYPMYEVRVERNWSSPISFNELLQLYEQIEDSITINNEKNFRTLCNAIRNKVIGINECSQESTGQMGE